MTPDLSTARIYTDFKGLADLRLAAKQHSDQSLGAVAKQFEAIFIQMMLKSMRDASLADGIFDSDQSKMYMDMFDQQLSLSLSGKGVFGIADMLVHQLANNTAGDAISPATAGSSPPPLQTGAQQPQADTAGIAGGAKAPPDFQSPQAFVEFMRPLAEQAAKKLGVKAEVLLAQAALETGWGKKIITGADGNSTHNLFGIKADQRWSGARATVNTLEYRDGVVSREAASFRAYDSFQQSFADYVDFIKQGARYQAALGQAGDARHYIQALQAAGYATDPGYAEKVMDIMQGDSA